MNTEFENEVKIWIEHTTRIITQMQLKILRLEQELQKREELQDERTV